MARDKEEGASVRLLLFLPLSSPPWSSHKAAQHGQRRGSLQKRACIYIYTHIYIYIYIHTRVCTHAYTVVSFERKMERDSWAAMQVLWKEEERERERRRKAKSKRERKKRKEREGRGTTTTVFILEKG